MIARMKVHHLVALALLTSGCGPQANVAAPPQKMNDHSAAAVPDMPIVVPRLTEAEIEDAASESFCRSFAGRIHAIALARDQGIKPEAALAAVKSKDDTADDGAALLALTAEIYSPRERSRTPEQISRALFENCLHIGKYGVPQGPGTAPSGPLLLMAPMKPDGSLSDPDAPLAQWTHVGVSHSAKQCEQVIVKTVNEAPPVIREKLRANFLCIAIDDPRLK
jgi:hypothetical protein